ncbi:hypothetical protein PPERSA_08921 [Pseudocohnilembus persalinus]|uniref:Uncharacterized protein n=1 Tax=Pseudocohnilembus persalinus TaxID=266149 RepID=A0A0V0R2V5_PSEPJ|nr:hypothetical protein PPERSA_08921 [Pseudocohnilembus persalinus]|eukprot:KRX08817.1 hypothetical protein PPERSA_08921 [Pseudocohnilembus persalinus]
MQGKGYILKRVYIERDLLREQKSHQQRLAEIKKKQVSVDVNPIDKQLKKSKLNHVKSTQFKELEENRKQQVVNSMLVRKLEDINKGKFSVARPLGQSQSVSQFKASQQTFKTSNSKSINSLGKGSLNNVGRRLEEERIARENHALAQRMINLPPVIQKKKQDKDFKKNKQLHNQILRFHHLKDKKEKKYGRRKFDKLVSDSSDDEFDPNDEELMNKKVIKNQKKFHSQIVFYTNFLKWNCAAPL